MEPCAPVDPLTGQSAARFGVYVHFPYCLKKCPYCDFASRAVAEVPSSRYAQAVIHELEQRLSAGGWPSGPADSCYVGGGTPSLWAPEALGHVLKQLQARVGLAAGAEVTVEANPGVADAERFRLLRGLGVNRLSLGVQSFEPHVLSFLGRVHSAREAENAFRAARQAGFDNLSMDFLFGVPGQTVGSVRKDAKRAMALGPEHVSLYALTLEREALAEEVLLAQSLARGEFQLPPEDEVLAMAQAAREVYAQNGLVRYEVSNFARPGFESRHNCLYWTGGDYLGLGAGATGFLRQAEAATRYSNPRHPEEYFSLAETKRSASVALEQLGPGELFTERVAMGLRLAKGIDLEATCRSFGKEFPPRYRVACELVDTGVARWTGGRLALTDVGFNLHSEVATRLL